jgi:uncharacterized membrane protein YGL010W
MIELRARLVEFATWHKDQRNRWCHYLGIPAVTLPVLGFLSRVTFGVEVPLLGELDLALLLLAATLVFDLIIAWQLAPGVFLIGLLLWWIARPLPGPVLIAIFVVGWIFQLLGHRVFEKNAPAFTDNLVHLVVGPRWLVNRAMRVFSET